MRTLQVFLFRKFDMRWGEQTSLSFEPRKVQELFCYLLLYREQPHSRETLADLLWNDISTAQAKSYLRKALWQLQANLDAGLEGNPGQVFLVEPDWIQLNPGAKLWLDVAVFEQTFSLVQGVPGQELDSQRAETLRSAVDLYQGDLLEGWYCDWCLYQRERLQHMYLAMLDKLMDYCESHQQYEIGLTYGLRALRYDGARERTHRRLMRLHYRIGDRTAALRQYERCAAALEKELGVPPAQRTVALYQQIQADRLDEPPVLSGARPAAEMLTPLSEVLRRLQQLQSALSNFQRQVQQDIEAVEATINQHR